MKTWRYSIPSAMSQGWAILFLDEAGCFTALSDWGNVAYRWNPRGLPEGLDFRQFLLECDASYITSKLGQNRREYDAEATKEAIRSQIIQERLEAACCASYTTGGREKARTTARLEWDLVTTMGDAAEDFAAWHNDTSLCDPSEVYCTRYVGEVTNFVEHAWPRLREVMRCELSNEKALATERR
jgi:hypothetical protein